ncbi:MAG: hypothetical protein NBV67_00320 [Tagaea sp.]|nr:hypothetical protein [Tagaea sp.]
MRNSDMLVGIKLTAQRFHSLRNVERRPRNLLVPAMPATAPRELSDSRKHKSQVLDNLNLGDFVAQVWLFQKKSIPLGSAFLNDPCEFDGGHAICLDQLNDARLKINTALELCTHVGIGRNWSTEKTYNDGGNLDWVARTIGIKSGLYQAWYGREKRKRLSPNSCLRQLVEFPLTLSVFATPLVSEDQICTSCAKYTSSDVPDEGEYVRQFQGIRLEANCIEVAICQVPSGNNDSHSDCDRYGSRYDNRCEFDHGIAEGSEWLFLHGDQRSRGPVFPQREAA